MNRKVKEMWLTALRSGEFEQGTGRLRSDDDKFCCLGVLCELAHRAGVVHAAHSDLGGWTYGDEYSGGVLAGAVMEWAGLDYTNPSVPYKGALSWEPTTISLASLNDLGRPFGEIADTIEAHL